MSRPALVEPRTAGSAAHRHAGGRRRRGRLIGAGVVVLVLAGGAAVVVPRWLRPHPVTVCGADPLQSAAVAGLANFAGWLRRNDAAGYVGEIGWPSGPDGARWAALADTWYRAADAIGLPVTAWAAARWPASYPMAVYRHSSGSAPLDTAGPQATVVGAHPSTRRYLRGVVVASGSFGAADASDTFSSTNRGRFGYDYGYESAAGYAYLAAQGIRLVRLTLTWERIQPVPGGPLDPGELARLRQALSQARQAGLRVIIDLHGYGTFHLGTAGGPRALVLGSTELPVGQLADLWARLARATVDQPAVLGYDVLNEPVTLAVRGAVAARLWEQASQAAVDAIRAAGSTAFVAVTGYGTTSPANWGQLHPRPWLTDPRHRVLYEAHAYFDADSSGHYDSSYADEVARAGAAVPRCQTLPELTGGLR